MRKLMGLITFICITLCGFAQQEKVEVKGVVVDNKDQLPVEQATIRLLSLVDSAMINGAVTNPNGSFSLKEIPSGNYLLHVSYIGFEPVYQPLTITGRNNPVNLGKLSMITDNILLKDAVVIAQIAEVTINNDTIEFNADAFKIAEGSMLEDLLKKMPGVDVDKEGAVTINGKEIKKVLVDGKEFFSDDPKVATKNLPAKMVEKVQTYEKKSDMAMLTGFDDGEEEDVINLIIRPGMKHGWIGNAIGGYGSEDRYEGNAMLNRFKGNDRYTITGGLNNTGNMGFSDRASGMFSEMSGGRRNSGGNSGGGTNRNSGNRNQGSSGSRAMSSGVSSNSGSGNGIATSGNMGTSIHKEFNKKLSLNGSFQYSHSDRDAISSSLQENIFPNDSSTFENSKSHTQTISNNYATSFRMEWKPDDKTTLIFTPRFNYSQSNTISDDSTLSYDNRNEKIYHTKENSSAHSKGYNLNGDLTFSRKLNDKGRVLTLLVSGGYSDRENEGDNYSLTKYYRRTSGEAQELLDQIFSHTTHGHNYRTHISWVEPLGRNNFLQFSYNFSRNKQESIKSTYGIDGEGFYSLLDSAYSQSYENDFITQRVTLNFQARREKYRYTIGFNADPSYNRSRTFVKSETLSDLSRSVINFSPMATLDYLWNRRTNLRVSYNGSTNQPSITQLQPIDEIISATNIRRGNPELKPSYTNRMSVRYQKYSEQQQSMLMVSGSFNYVVNAITSNTAYEDDGSGNRITKYENVNGNHNSSLNVSFNSPFRNRKFTYNTATTASYSHTNGFVNGGKNSSNHLSLQERMGLNFRSDYLDLSINGNVTYNDISNSLQGQNDQNTWKYGCGGSTTIYLPYEFRIESDLTYSAYSGYADGYNQKETLWNASASKSFLKGNQAMLRFRIYDILQKRSNISRTVTASYIRDSEYNTLNSYFIVQFVYRFNVFAGGSSRRDMSGERRGTGGMGGERRERGERSVRPALDF